MISGTNINRSTRWLMLPLVLLISVLHVSCEQKPETTEEHAKHQTYTCPMHPQIVQNQPGTCPICGMDLVAFDKNNVDEFLTLSESQQALANVTTMTVGTGEFSSTKQLNGRVAVNPRQTEFISSRVPGRIEKLHIRETGVPVKKGEPVYTIYSEQLAALQQEYLVAAAQASEFPDDQKFQQIVQAAEQRLKLYDQSEAQIKQLSNQKKTSPHVTYYAKVDGIVAEVSVTEGQYVSEGSPVLRLESYGNIWIEADIYPSEQKLVKKGQTVNVTISGYENDPQTMKIDFITPALETGSQLITIRGSIPNPGNKWQPGLQAIIHLPVNDNTAGITVPNDAVIQEEKGAHVWVESEKGKFEPREVSVGKQNDDQIEVKEGLDEGDVVVITGAYLLYSEYVLKKGKHPVAN